MILHALTDHRRILPIERLGTTMPAHPDFLLVVSYNPGYQATARTSSPARGSVSWPSSSTTRVELEAGIIAHEAGVDDATAGALAFLGERLRNLDEADIIDGPSTRLLVYAAR